MEQIIPVEVEQHLQTLLSDQLGIELLKKLWLKKDKLFSDQIALLKMEDLSHLEMDEKRALLLLTFSGSLVTLGCGEKRTMEYASIKLRTDVPHIIKSEQVTLISPLDKGASVSFSGGQLQNTSALYKIVVCPEGLSVDEQEKRVREASIFITNSFVQLNKDLTKLDLEESSDSFNKKEIVKYIALKNELSQKLVKDIIDDYGTMIETGLLLGKSVPIASLGKFSMKWTNERKARLGRNPATGEEITIGAKRAHYSPSFKFSHTLKERCERIEKEND